MQTLSQQSGSACRHQRGFTLIELLTVILVMGILMAVAMPIYNGAVADAQKRTCRANMQSIANAEQAYKVRSTARVYTNDLTVTSPLLADLGAIPKCPTAGTYTVTNTDGTAITAASTTFTVHCNVAAHDAAYVTGEPAGYTLNVNTQ